MKIIIKSLICALPLFIISCNGKKISEPKKDRYLFTIKGSDTEYDMVKKLCNEFYNSDSLAYSIEGGGTELGIKALIEGKVDMATASREITEKEKNILIANNISALPIMFATDAVAVITHPRLGVDSLTLDQISKIFKGEIVNWKEVDGPDRKITIYTRNMNSGTYSYFKNKVTHGEFIASAKVCQTTKEIVESVNTDSTGIGYAGAGFLMDEHGKPSNKIWAMPISIDAKHNAYSPYQIAEVKNGNYPLTRPLYQYYRLPLNEKVKKFAFFELTRKGQDLIRTFGYFPINNYQTEINKLNGFNL